MKTQAPDRLVPPLEYRDAGCMQFEPGLMLGLAIYTLTNGKPCPGCPKNGACGAQAKLSAPSPESAILLQPIYGETVRQEAARRTLSLSEVRRQRKAALP